MNELQVITSRIITLPNRPLFMLDSDVAALYGTETKFVNLAVRRNPERFPEDFYFQLTQEEVRSSRFEVADCNLKNNAPGNFEVADCDLKNDGRGGRRYLPYGFTREGCNMLSAVLSTPTAIARSVQIMRAFSAIEKSRAAMADAPDSALLPNGWQMYELRMTYGTDGARRIMKELYGVGPDSYRTDIAPHEAKVISVNNPNVGHRNHMIYELVQRGVSSQKIADLSGISRQSIFQISKKMSRFHQRKLAPKN